MFLPILWVGILNLLFDVLVILCFVIREFALINF